MISLLAALVGFIWSASSRPQQPLTASIVGLIEGSGYPLLVRAGDAIGQGLSMQSFGIGVVGDRLVLSGIRLLFLGFLILAISLLIGEKSAHCFWRVFLVTGIVAAIITLTYWGTNPIGFISMAVTIASEAGAFLCFRIDKRLAAA